jgi:hypothetical protein
MRRSDAMGRGCEDGKGGAPLDGEARFGGESTARHTSDPARSAESAVRELNGALAEAELSLEDFKEAHRSVFLGARSSAEGSSRSDRARWRPKFASRHLHRHSRPGVPCSQHVAFASSIVLGTTSGAAKSRPNWRPDASVGRARPYPCGHTASSMLATTSRPQARDGLSSSRSCRAAASSNEGSRGNTRRSFISALELQSRGHCRASSAEFARWSRIPVLC